MIRSEMSGYGEFGRRELGEVYADDENTEAEHD